MTGSGVAGIASTASALDAAQLAANYQANIQRDILNVQQDLIAKLFASLGVGANLDLVA